MNKLLKYPVWFLEIFTTAKSFRDNPILGSRLANRLGLHVIRILISHGIMRFRMLLLSFPISAEDKKMYFSQGFLIKENFLPEEDFEKVEQEAKSFKGEVREARQGDTLTHRAVLSPEALVDNPNLEQFLYSKDLLQFLKFTSGHLRAPFYYLENIKNKYISGATDPQKHFHHDTFHPSMKCWYFIDDVEEGMGPFTYIPESHKLTWKRIKWEYKMSLIAKEHKNVLHGKGSTRYTDKDLKALGLGEPHAFTAKKNTLVIANVFGIHRRGDSENKSTRLALWGDSRTNPFMPLPGIGGKWVNNIQYYFLNQFRLQADQKAEERGVRSPWQVIQSKEK